MSHRGFRRPVAGLVTFALAGVVAFGCSDEDDGNKISSGGSAGSAASSGSAGKGGSSAAGGVATGGTGAIATGGTSGTSGTTGTTGGTSGGGTGGSGGVGSGGECAGVPYNPTPVDGGTTTDGGACVGVASEVEVIDIDMYIMMDRSVSMLETNAGSTQTRWDAVHDAIQAFVSDPRAAGLGVGIQFFGQSGVRDDTIDCDVNRYATPAVEIADLSTNGPAIFQAVENTVPGGITPMAPALDGALRHAKDWAAANFGKATIVVLVTDGFPTQCTPISVSQIAEMARQAYETAPRIRTFVIGLAAGLNLDAIARAGGGEAYQIDQGDTQQQFLDAMLNFTEGNLVCEYEVPAPPDPSVVVDFSKVQVVYSPAVGAQEEVPKVDNATQCGTSSAGGWYYDNNTNPTRILVCPCTCNHFGAGRVDVRLGCEPARPPPR